MNSSKFNAKIYNTMKHRLLLPLILACSTWHSYAEDIDVVYMITTLNSGTTKEIMLSNDTSFVGPKLFNKENRLIIDGKSYTPDDIQEIRFEKRTIDAIVTVESQVDMRNKDNAVYNLKGAKATFSAASAAR